MIIDGHSHVVPTDDGVKLLLDRMQESGVDATVVVPGGMIPTMGFADFLRGRKALTTSSPPNDFVLGLARKYPEQIYAFYQIDPLYDEVEDIEEASLAGFSGFKLNPLVNRVSFDDPAVHELIATVGRLGKPVYTHITLEGGASIDAFEKLVKANPSVPFILGHMGFASTDESAIVLARKHQNLFLETSVGSFTAIKEGLARLGAGKIIFGSEGPVHHPKVELEKILLCKLSPTELDLVLGKNIMNLLR